MSPGLKRRRSDQSAAVAPPPTSIPAPTDPSSAQISVPPKRQRVSRACDQCRAAREKCDGVQPQCYSCTSLSRVCTYTIAPKKRGVQTGLIRTLELTLAWVFENVAGSEDALAALISNESQRASGLLLDKENEEGIRLHKRWRKSRIHRGIDRLLSEKDGAPPRVSESPVDSDGDIQTSVASRDVEGRDMNPRRQAAAVGSALSPVEASLAVPPPLGSPDIFCSSMRASLPKNYQRLLEVYNSYTTCWLPILDQTTLLKTASSYPADGLVLEPRSSSTGSHAELWAALALASYQNAHSTSEYGGETRPLDVYNMARGLIPSSEHADLTKSHLKALLLLSLVQLGKEHIQAASHLVGMAVRLALQLRLSNQSGQADQQTSQDQVLVAICFSLDTLLGLLSGQPSHLRSESVTLDISAAQDGPLEWAQWSPCAGFGFFEPANSSLAPGQRVQPIKCFNQLFQFFRVLGHQSDLRSRVHQEGPDPGGTLDLVRSLAPEYSFCNSLIGSQGTAVVPSAYFVQAAFLTASLLLSPPSASSRVSLLWGLMEVIETYMSRFGACGCPPLLVVLMRLVDNEGHLDAMQESDRRRWASLSRALGTIWSSSDEQERCQSGEQPKQAMRGPDRILQDRNSQARPSSASQGQPIGIHPPAAPPTTDRRRVSFLNTASHPPVPLQQTNPQYTEPFPGLGPRPQPPSMLAYNNHIHLGNPGNLPKNMVPGSDGTDIMGQNMRNAGTLGLQARQPESLSNKGLDYDAMLDELAAADCTDTLDTDPAFMTNLGFAPGYDLDEFLRKGFGSF